MGVGEESLDMAELSDMDLTMLRTTLFLTVLWPWAKPSAWSMTGLNFFLFPFCEKSLICLEGKSMTPHRGNTILFLSSQQLPRLRLGPLKGFLS